MARSLEVPNLRHLRMVQTIGNLGGVNGAARALNTSQPAVTQAVRNLEVELGTPLFERHASGSFPTELGKRYLHRVDRFFEILDDAVARLAASHLSGFEATSLQADRLITNTQLRSFVVTCETGRVHHIAETLGLTVASLLRSARSLERVLGTPLFDRAANGLTPNKAGILLAREFGKAIREIELARDEILHSTGLAGLEIFVGIPPLPGVHSLANATNIFASAHAKVRVTFVSGEYMNLLADLRSGHLDMMYGVLRLPSWVDDLQEEAIYDDEYCIVVRPQHPLLLKGEVAAEDLAAYPWLAPPTGTPRRTRIEAIFETCASPPPLNLETTSLSLCKSFLFNSNAITLLPISEVESEIHNEFLSAIPITLFEEAQPKGITTRMGWLPAEAHLAFIECLRQAAGSNP